MTARCAESSSRHYAHFLVDETVSRKGWWKNSSAISTHQRLELVIMRKHDVVNIKMLLAEADPILVVSLKKPQ